MDSKQLQSELDNSLKAFTGAVKGLENVSKEADSSIKGLESKRDELSKEIEVLGAFSKKCKKIASKIGKIIS